MVWVCVVGARHVTVDAKDVGPVLGHESKQSPIGPYVCGRDWRFDFRRRDQFERQRPVSLLERKAESLSAGVIEHLRDDVAIILPDKQALAVKRSSGKPQISDAFRRDTFDIRRQRIRFFDFINGQRIPFAIIVPDVANVHVSSAVDGGVFPIV